MKLGKTMGLAILMALTMTALLGANSASASQFRAQEYSTSANGAQGVQNRFKTTPTSSGIGCGTATATGTIAEASSTLTLTPAFSSCSYVGFGAPASVNSCKYVLHSTNEEAPYTGTIDIACSKEGDAIEFKTSACTVKFPAQSSLGPISLANTGFTGSSRSITATFNVTGLKSTETGTCPNPGTHENGTFTGTSVLTGSNLGFADGIYLGSKQVEPPPLFQGEEYSTVINTAPQTAMQFNFPGGSLGYFNCTGFEGNGILNNAAGVLVQNIMQWNGCYAGGGFSVNINHCAVTLKATTIEAGGAAGLMGVSCPTGSAFSFSNGPCTVSIPSQSNRTAMKFENVGAGTTREVIATFSVGNLKFTAGGGCTEPGTRENGFMSGALRLKGYQNVGFQFIEGEYIRYLTTGSRKGIWVG